MLKALKSRELEFALGDWETWARLPQIAPDRLEPDRTWSTWLIMGGRGSGKTRVGAEWVRQLVRSHKDSAGPDGLRIVLVGPSYAETRAVMVDGVSGLLSLDWQDMRPEFISSRRVICWPNGAVAQLFSAEDPEELRGPQFGHAWCDGTKPLPAMPVRLMTGCCFALSRWVMQTRTRRLTR